MSGFRIEHGFQAGHLKCEFIAEVKGYVLVRVTNITSSEIVEIMATPAGRKTKVRRAKEGETK